MVTSHAGPNLDILGVKFDSKLIFEDHVHGIGILRLVKHVSVDTCVTSLPL